MDDIIEHIIGKYKPQWDSRFAYHMSQDQLDIPYDTYSKRQRVALGKKVLQKARIYLDLKYWIYIRDAYWGHAQKSIHNEIASCLYKLVEFDYAICPANWNVLGEILKQTDPVSRLRTCKIIDDLCRQIIIEPHILLYDIELTHLIALFISKRNELHQLNELVWGHAGHILGQSIPSIDALDKNPMNAFQKAFLDTLSEVTFSEMANIFATSPIKAPFDYPEYEEKRTCETTKHKDEFDTFQQVYEIELFGFLDEIKAGIYEVLNFLHLKKFHTPYPIENVPMFMTYFLECFRQHKLTTEFPQLHINAKIHATMRYKNMPFKKGDFYDHFHASSAIPYCNYFFTEKKLAHFLIEYPLSLDKDYGCKILYKEEDVLKELKKLSH